MNENEKSAERLKQISIELVKAAEEAEISGAIVITIQQRPDKKWQLYLSSGGLLPELAVIKGLLINHYKKIHATQGMEN